MNYDFAKNDIKLVAERDKRKQMKQEMSSTTPCAFCTLASALLTNMNSRHFNLLLWRYIYDNGDIFLSFRLLYPKFWLFNSYIDWTTFTFHFVEWNMLCNRTFYKYCFKIPLFIWDGCQYIQFHVNVVYTIPCKCSNIKMKN